MDLDHLFAQPTTPQTVQAQCYEAKVARVTARGVFVTIPGYDAGLFWGPCLPEDATAHVGERVVILMSNRGRPWLMATRRDKEEESDG